MFISSLQRGAISLLYWILGRLISLMYDNFMPFSVDFIAVKVVITRRSKNCACLVSRTSVVGRLFSGTSSGASF